MSVTLFNVLLEGHRGFEPLTIGFEDQDSSTELMSLNYIIKQILLFVKFGISEWIRTTIYSLGENRSIL